MISFFFRRRYNLFDTFVIAVVLALGLDGHFILAGAAFAAGVTTSILGELALESRAA